ncbi:MAG: hypothetical protein V3V08_17255 [Nannocystaceae bacterium]
MSADSRSGKNVRRLAACGLQVLVCGASTLVAVACAADVVGHPPDTGGTADGVPPFFARQVIVNLDGEPVEGATVMQGGANKRWLTGPDGGVDVVLDTSVRGEIHLVASHPQARTLTRRGSKTIEPDETEPVVIDLTRVDPRDNPEYEFQHPGSPELHSTQKYCSHCHLTIGAGWHASPHRTAASNPAVQDLYVGVSSAVTTLDDCEGVGGRWAKGLAPGSTGSVMRCYLGDGVLGRLNPQAGLGEVARKFGGCADCHAPGINGQIGGRDLMDATGVAYEYGVHCDVCHKVENVDLSAPAGVAGRLKVHRPSETSASSDWAYLSYGPYYDVPTAAMGAVPRDHFRESQFCAGCHQLDQDVLVPGSQIDLARWPDGKLPIHSTYSEWETYYDRPQATCSSCHMSVATDVLNAADLQELQEINPKIKPSAVVGWERSVGEVRTHEWKGPRSEVWAALQLAAEVTVRTHVTSQLFTVDVTVENVGPGHALPTGEPLRSVVLHVSASCGGEALAVAGGDVVPDFGGSLDKREAGEDWAVWLGARQGDVLRVVRDTAAWHDYPGYGPFGDGRFTPAQKGMPVEVAVGTSLITFVAADGKVVLDRPLLAGDRVYRGEVMGGASPRARALAGAPGFGFARVLVGPEGERMVPHFAAVDVASDNRLLPAKPWTSHHQFHSLCDEPRVRTTLLLRAYPLGLALERGWQPREIRLVDQLN